jgi:hypothetical protein
MNRLRTMHPTRRLAVLFAWLAGALLATVTAAPAALAGRLPPSGFDGTVKAPLPAVHVTVSGGMPGWQITLIAVGAAMAAAVVAVVLDRARAARRRMIRAAA